MRAAGAADDGAPLRRPLEERPAPPRRPPTPFAPPRREERREPCRPPCPRRDSGAPLSQHQRKERAAVRIPGRRSSGREVIRQPTEEIVGTPAAPMTREEFAP